MQPASGNGHVDWTDDFERVLADEHARINQWRARHGRGPVKSSGEDFAKTFDTTGLALSGGGIRSAAFCLGALQALDGSDKIKNLDYLSTVSGGGYIGTSFTAGMNATKGKFPFSAGPGDKSDNHAVGHIRNYAKYLMPRGFWDLVASLTVILRGLSVNLAFVTAFVLLMAGLTCWMNPNQDALGTADLFGWENFPGHASIASLGVFTFTKLLLIFGLAFFVCWGFFRSYQTAPREFTDGRPKCGDIWSCAAFALVVLTACVFLLEFQPFAIKGVFDITYSLPAPTDEPAGAAGALTGSGAAPKGVIGFLTSQLAWIMKYLAPLSAALAVFSKYFGDIIKTKAGESTWRALGMRLASFAAIGLVALALPIIIWLAYLHASVWGDIGFIFRPAWMQGLVGFFCGVDEQGRQLADAATRLADYEQARRQYIDILSNMVSHGAFDPTIVAPTLESLPVCRAAIPTDPPGAPDHTYLIVQIYLGIGLALLAAAVLCLKPNANSLHRLYRDRLSKTFLFDPGSLREKSLRERVTQDPDPLDRLRFADLDPKHGPVHIVNAALNIQGSRWANKRGRKADFFFFSPVWTGSRATGFEKTSRLAAKEQTLDLGTAMAISGAAASSNMGSRTVWGLAPTLALLNIRLGFWMKNPRNLSKKPKTSSWVRLRRRSKLYLLSEMFGLLDEDSPNVYLTDGGHIENLGLYELLRRRCRKIIVIDAEADPYMNFRSLVDAERFARIDLGVRIRLPWQEIRDQAKALNAQFEKGDLAGIKTRGNAAHAAVGAIDYGPGEDGVIIYVKASLTGDENDNILGYKSRYSDFPHENTGDQFFSEEQFEVYRALGNHALCQALGKNEAYVADDCKKLPSVAERQPAGVDEHLGEKREKPPSGQQPPPARLDELVQASKGGI
jgi:Patatin-like phospholipase